jgi:hypothetical protein
MLWICSDVSKYSDFKNRFKKEHFLDLSRVPSSCLADECDSIVNHHSKCVVFLGFLEPGWMLEPTHQTRIRKLFRKFEVGMITNFVESLPFSWKNEIHTFYLQKPLNGNPNFVNNGSALQDQS